MSIVTDFTCRYLGVWCPPPSIGRISDDTPLDGLVAPEECDDTFDCDPNQTFEDYYYCMLDHNTALNRCLTNIAERRAVEDADRVLELVNAEPTDDIYSYFDPHEVWLNFSEVFRALRRVNQQTDNWLLLAAAMVAFNNYQIIKHQQETYLSLAPEEELRAARCQYLDQALTYIETALNNPARGYGFDLAHFGTWQYISTDPIPYIEGYFELQTARIAIYQMYATEGDTNRTLYDDRLQELTTQLNQELSDFRFVVAMGSSPANTEGYTNRIRLMLNEQLLWDASADLPDLLEDTQESYRWASHQESRPLIIIWYYGMRHRDLIHDALAARMQEARTELRLANEDEATRAEHERTANQIFTSTLFDTLITTRQYGGYLDIGTEALFYLLRLTFTDPNVTTRDEAAERFTQLIGGDGGWNWLDHHTDLKETLGMLIRRRDWRSYTPNIPGLQNTDQTSWEQLVGNWALEMGAEWMVPTNTTPILTALDLSGHVEGHHFSQLAGSDIDETTQTAIIRALYSLEYIDENGELQPAFNGVSEDDFVGQLLALHVPLTDLELRDAYAIIRHNIQPTNLARMDMLMHCLMIRYYDRPLLQQPLTQWEGMPEH